MSELFTSLEPRKIGPFELREQKSLGMWSFDASRDILDLVGGVRGKNRVGVHTGFAIYFTPENFARMVKHINVRLKAIYESEGFTPPELNGITIERGEGSTWIVSGPLLSVYRSEMALNSSAGHKPRYPEENTVYVDHKALLKKISQLEEVSAVVNEKAQIPPIKDADGNVVAYVSDYAEGICGAPFSYRLRWDPFLKEYRPKGWKTAKSAVGGSHGWFECKFSDIPKFFEEIAAAVRVYDNAKKDVLAQAKKLNRVARKPFSSSHIDMKVEAPYLSFSCPYIEGLMDYMIRRGFFYDKGSKEWRKNLAPIEDRAAVIEEDWIYLNDLLRP